MRKNRIETFDNLLFKMDNPSYEGTFYDVYKLQKLFYPQNPILEGAVFS